MRHDDVWVSSVPVEPLFTDIITVVLFRSPFYKRAILCFAHVFFYFVPSHFFRCLQTENFETFLQDVMALLKKEAPMLIS